MPTPQQNEALLKELEVSWTGISLDAGPAPAFFYFALSAHDSLHLEPYCQPAQFLNETPFRCYSLSLPHHGDELDPKKAMHYWAQAAANGEDLLGPFLEKAQHAIDQLIKADLILPDQIYAGGLSRGAFIALNLAAVEYRIKAVVGFAPLIDLSALNEFHSFDFASNNLVPKLLKTKVRLYIGNHDLRVGTDRVYQFIRDLAEEKFKAGERSPQAEIFISASIGHKGHGTSPETFKMGTDWIASQPRN